MRRLVEDFGPALCSGRFGMWHRMTGAESGTTTVGARAIAWTCTRADAVDVTHADASGVPVSYAVATVTTTIPHTGERLWWSCPACARRVGKLYLPDGRDRLACRLCCGLGYASQYPGVRRRPRQSAPAFTCTTTVGGWVAGRVRLQVSRSVRTFPGRPFVSLGTSGGQQPTQGGG